MTANDDTAECIHGLGLVAHCTICNGRDEREQRQAAEVEYKFPATRDWPLACGHTPSLGEIICRMGDGRILCEECVP